MILETPATPAIANVSLALREWAGREPGRCAVRTFGREPVRVTFGELENRVNALARGLGERGLGRGDRVSLFVPPGVELVALFHALLRLGAVPVLIDPGMGRRALLGCIERTAPRVLIGVARAHVARALFPRAFASVELAFSPGARRRWPGIAALPLADIPRRGEQEFRAEDPAPDRAAAILFTSGSTGPPKGVVYSHATFAAQLAALRECYALEPGEVDCACFPLFALFDHALGMTSVFPELDPSRPGACEPSKITGAIESSGATFGFGSPAIWRRVLPWARERGVRFSSLRRIAIAGAPVPPALVLGLRQLLAEGGEVHTPYGATEALPVTDLTGNELARGLRERVEAGEGSCVGRALAGIELALIRITDEALGRWSDDLRVGPLEPGEICVRGPIVTREYLFDEPATRAAKIPEAAGAWHRMGDIGRLDVDGRLWFLGRKSHRLETERGLLFPVPLENAFDICPGIARTALVGVGARGRERAHLVVQPERGTRTRELLPRLRSRARGLAGGERVEGFLFRSGFPLDVRHNAKIRREELKSWAQRRVR